MALGVLELLILASVVVVFLFALNNRRPRVLIGLGVAIALPLLVLAGVVWTVSRQPAGPAEAVLVDLPPDVAAAMLGELTPDHDDLHDFIHGHPINPEFMPSPVTYTPEFAMTSWLVVLLLGALVVIGVVAAVKHRRWQALAGAGFVVGAMLFFHLGDLTQPRPAAVLRPTEVIERSVASPPSIPLDTLDAVEAEVATDADFTDPDLDEAFPERKSGQVVLTCDPSATLSGLRKKGAAALAAWVDAEVRDAHGVEAIRFVREALAPGDYDAYADRFSPADHLSEVNTSVGRVYVLRVLAEMDEANQKWIAETVAQASAAAQRGRRVRSIAFTGLGVLGLVAMAHLILRNGPSAAPGLKEEAA